MEWYYVKNGAQQGPVSREQLLELAAGGGLDPNDLVWNQTMGESWAAASTVPGLFAEAQPVAAGTGGTTPNAELMRQAREQLTGLWGISALAVLIFYAIMFAGGAIPILNLVLSLVLTGPMTLGIMMVFLGVARGEGVTLSRVFDGFKLFGTSVLAYILMNIFIFLWFLLLIVPGILASLSYSMTFFVLADNPGMGPMEAIDRSKELMRGHRWKLFCLYCRFIGWALLAAIFTLCIGFFWLEPYIKTSMARFYDDLNAPAGA